jgi:hypothetical protein
MAGTMPPSPASAEMIFEGASAAKVRPATRDLAGGGVDLDLLAFLRRLVAPRACRRCAQAGGLAC